MLEKERNKGDFERNVNVDQALPDNKTSCHSKLDLESHHTLLRNNEILNQVQDDKRGGFTLIELLVVVLIIGILVAVALPQYQMTVEKSKATQAFTLLKSVYNAAQTYYLEQGAWPSSFSQLDVAIPWTGHVKEITHVYATDTLSNEDWSLQLYHEPNVNQSVTIYRTNGRYAHAGFLMCNKCYPRNVPAHQIVCRERDSDGYDTSVGSYCNKLFRGILLRGESNAGRSYTLP